MRLYLDKNVLTELTKPNATNEIKELQVLLETGNFFIPFSDAHIQDMMKSDPSYHHDDLARINTICKGAYFQRDITKNNEVNYFIATANEVYDALQQEPDVLYFLDELNNDGDSFDRTIKSFFSVKFFPNIVNLFPIEFQQPIYARVKKFGLQDATLDMHQFYEMCITLYALFRDSPNYYKELRNYLSTYVNLNLHDHYDLKSMQDINNAFNEKLGKTLSSFIEDISGKGKERTVTFADQLYQIFMMLDQFGLMKDKLDKKNTYINMSNDAHHALYASHCDVLISNDKNMRGKSAKVYELLNVNTKVVTVRDFLKQYGNKPSFRINELFNEAELISQENTEDGRFSLLYKEHFWGFFFDTCQILDNTSSNKVWESSEVGTRKPIAKIQYK